MSRTDHLSERLMIGAMDDELSASEERVVNKHLGECEDCKRRYQDLGRLSSGVQSLVEGVAVRAPDGEREALLSWLEQREREATKRTPVRNLIGWRAGAAMAMSAALAIGVFFHLRPSGVVASGTRTAFSQPIQTFELANESFVALPFVTTDLPLTTPEIVRMKVPLASLTDVGIVERSGTSNAADDSVLADVLLGADGEPVGVHVLNFN